MAYQQFSLRPLKLTHRTPGQPVVVRDVHRGSVTEECGSSPKESKMGLDIILYIIVLASPARLQI